MRYVGLCAVAALLTACSTAGTTETGKAEVACTGFGPITYDSAQDSAETIEQIRAHNRAWVCVCEPQEAPEGLCDDEPTQ
jgi:hypothetical protein